tara:strand:+ start:569 stop:760 length:192 start_codon:yes stop_codon:yes gene_type:complete
MQVEVHLEVVFLVHLFLVEKVGVVQEPLLLFQLVAQVQLIQVVEVVVLKEFLKLVAQVVQESL